MNRGKPMHKRQVAAIAGLWRLQPCEVFIEYQIMLDGTRYYIDVLVDQEGYRIGIEVEMSTRYVVVNARTALRFCHELHLLFPTARLRNIARRKLATKLRAGKLDRTVFLLLSAYEPISYLRKTSFLRGNRITQKSEKTENESELE